LIILDEADAMTKTAQFALRRVIEKYTKSTRFCLICNYINKIIPALQSRCTRFRFGPLESEQVRTRLTAIADTEGVNVDEGGMTAMIKLAGGDMRKCLNVMQACHLAYPEVNQVNVYTCTGKPLPSDIQKSMELLCNSPVQEAVEELSKLQLRKGLSLSDVVTLLHELVLRTSFPPPVLMFILDKLADVEHRLCQGVNEKIQLGALVGIFHIAAHMSATIGKKSAP